MGAHYAAALIDLTPMRTAAALLVQGGKLRWAVVRFAHAVGSWAARPPQASAWRMRA
jgi:hypothetical protein